MTTRVVRHIGELTTNDPSIGDESVLGRLVDAAMVVDDEQVLWVGPNRDAPDADEMLDAKNGAVSPIAGALDQPGDVRHHELAALELDGLRLARGLARRSASRDEKAHGRTLRRGRDHGGDQIRL